LYVFALTLSLDTPRIGQNLSECEKFHLYKLGKWKGTGVAKDTNHIFKTIALIYKPLNCF